MNAVLPLVVAGAALATAAGALGWILLHTLRSRTGPEIPELRSHFNQMVGEYEALPNHRIAPQYKAEIDSLLRKMRDRITWDDVFRFELLMLKLDPPDKLIRKAWLLRSRYRDIAGGDAYKRYDESHPPRYNLPSDPPEEEEARARWEARVRQLRSDLEVLLEDTHWRYRLQSSWETQRNWLSGTFVKLYALFMVLAAAAVLLLEHSIDRSDGHPMVTLLAVPFAGALGGFLSLMHRVHRVPNDPDHPTPLLQMEYGRGALLAQALITGAISATALFLLFAAGLLSGNLFPKLEPIGGNGIIHLLASVPQQSAEFAKLLVWAFIAGFAERLVPDFLDSIAKTAAKEAPAAGRADGELAHHAA